MMHRRSFIRKSSLGVTAGLLFPHLLSGCKKDELGNFPDGFRIIVVGAGAAGLYAAKMMKDHGAEVVILEASDRIGGRIRKNDDFADFPIDLGAEWVHGNKSLSHRLAQNAGFQIFEDGGEEAYLINGQISPNYSSSVLENIVGILDGDLAYNGPDMSVLHYAQQQGISNSDLGILEYIAGEFGTSANRLSILFTQVDSENWSSGNKDFKFKRSYFDLINETVAASVIDDVLLNSPVTQINYSSEKVIATVASGSTFEADRILITASVAVLKTGAISFIPALPKAKLQAIQSIGMDAGMKILLKFSQNFWNSTSLIGAQNSPVYWHTTYGKNGSDLVLSAFVMGQKAEALSAMGQAAIPHVLSELDLIYNGQATASFVDGLIQDWSQEPYVLGAYSYSSLGIGNQRSILAQSVNGKVHFAGEATAINGHFQTVQGALESGEREFLAMLQSVN
ncbi:MAG: FAD-dependent oxidoreductase [Flavobacteriales bacterium]|nr:FAD-dependent oxidoreductase [Flavobacteriales bacterium]